LLEKVLDEDDGDECAAVLVPLPWLADDIEGDE
jgi:hypothetical protein